MDSARQAELDSTLTEDEDEEYVFAYTHEANPIEYLGGLIKHWFIIVPFRFLTFKHHTSTESPSLKTSAHAGSSQVHVSWEAIVSIIILKALLLIAKPAEWFGNVLEYFLNLTYANKGLGKTLRTFLFHPSALKWPGNQTDANYYSVIGLQDPRQDLQLPEDIFDDLTELESEEGIKGMADVCIMASKVAYENENVIKKAVEKEWKMNFVKFYNCWNDYLACNGTQAFIFTDKKQYANIIVVAFRGTQPFSMYDWCTDFDFSYYVLPEIGRVHVGFLEGLGLGNRLKRETLQRAKANTSKKANKQTSTAAPTSGLSEDVINDSTKLLAYDEITAEVQDLLKQNRGARLYVTGHSLGGALAALFGALVLIEDHKAASSLGGIFTYGQPRIGDVRFAGYMEKKLGKLTAKKYFRVVFRTDVVPRVPFDDEIFQFKHISPCHYYGSSLECKALHEEPYKDLMLAILQPMPHLSALKELSKSLYKRLWGGREVETGLAIAVRFLAVLCPGLCAHFPSNYVDAVRCAPSSFLLKAEIE